MQDTGHADRSESSIQLSNEFAFVEVDVVQTGNGHRLRVTSPSKNRSVLIDPFVLEALTAMTPEQMSEFVDLSFDPKLQVRAEDE